MGQDSEHLVTRGTPSDHSSSDLQAINERLLIAGLREQEMAEQYRRQLAFTAAITGSIGEGVYALDQDGRFTLFNPTAERLLGWTEAELLGREAHSILHIHGSGGMEVHPESCALRDVVHTGQTYRNADDRFVRKDGSLLAVGYSSAPIVTSGKVTGTVVAFSDVTERNRVEEEAAQRMRRAALGADVGAALTQGGSLPDMLRRCADALVTHLDAAFAGIWTLDLPKQVLELQASAGPYRHLDASHEGIPDETQLIGRIASERRPHLTNDVISDPQFNDPEWARREGMVAFAGYPMVDDRVVGVMALFSKHMLSGDSLDAVTSVVQTIATGIERKRVEAQLEHALSFRDQFLSITSHELNTPMTGIKGYAQLLVKRAQRQGDDDLVKTLGVIIAEVNRMTNLVHDLSDVARVEHGGMQLSLTPFDLGVLLNETVSEIGVTASDFAFHVHERSPELRIRGDRERIKQVLINLLTNALKYSDTRKEADVSIRQSGDMAVISVVDYGIGIPLSEQATVFGLNVRGTNVAAEQASGLGLGLYISKAIIDLHSGSLSVVSEQGVGSTFTLKLPLLPKGEAAPDQ